MIEAGQITQKEDGSIVVRYPSQYQEIPVDPQQEHTMKSYVGCNVEYVVKTTAIGTSEFDVTDCDVAHIIGTPRKPKTVKTPRYEYGVLVTKPWSKEMYDHNDKVAKQVKQNLLTALSKAYDCFTDKDETVYKGDELYTIAKAICGYGWSGTSAIDVYNDAQDTLFVSSAYWLNDIYPDLVKEGYVKAVDPFFVGFNK